MEVSKLLGKTLTAVTMDKSGDDEIVFTVSEDEQYKLLHYQNCCESVNIEDINGDLADLVGTPILVAEEVSNEEPGKTHGDPADEDSYVYRDESFTWTFYKFATIKGSVTVRWYGSSNGYYSESVDFVKVGASRWGD